MKITQRQLRKLVVSILNESDHDEFTREDEQELKTRLDSVIAKAFEDGPSGGDLEEDIIEDWFSGNDDLFYAFMETLDEYSGDFDEAAEVENIGFDSRPGLKRDLDRLQHSKTKARAREQGPASQEMEDEIEALMWSHGAKPTVVSEV